jgi:hypothetical protein
MRVFLAGVVKGLPVNWRDFSHAANGSDRSAIFEELTHTGRTVIISFSEDNHGILLKTLYMQLPPAVVLFPQPSAQHLPAPPVPEASSLAVSQSGCIARGHVIDPTNREVKENMPL